MITTDIDAFSCCDIIKVWNETEGISSKIRSAYSFSPNTLNNSKMLCKCIPKFESLLSQMTEL